MFSPIAPQKRASLRADREAASPPPLHPVPERPEEGQPHLSGPGGGQAVDPSSGTTLCSGTIPWLD